METMLVDYTANSLVKQSIKANWKNYHYCLGRSPSVELCIGRYLTWLITSVPDHFFNLVVCTQLPVEGADELIENALTHFRALRIRKVTWIAEDTISAQEIKNYLLTHGLTFHESYGMEMAVDLASVPENLARPTGLEIVRVADGETLRQWVHAASIGFEIPQEFESIWCDFFEVAVFDLPFQTYLAVLNGKPVGTSQLFVSAGVAGIYNVTCVPEARGQGIGAAITQAPLLDARQMGYRVGILQASELGRRVYRRLGFEDYGGLSVYHWEN